jgi:hypothetical protein
MRCQAEAEPADDDPQGEDNENDACNRTSHRVRQPTDVPERGDNHQRVDAKRKERAQHEAGDDAWSRPCHTDTSE